MHSYEYLNPISSVFFAIMSHCWLNFCDWQGIKQPHKINELLLLTGNKRATLDWQSRLKIAIGAARGLRYLHEDCRVGCIVHRDMRPNNILLTHDFEPQVHQFLFFTFFFSNSCHTCSNNNRLCIILLTVLLLFQVADFGLVRWHSELCINTEERVIGTSGYLWHVIRNCLVYIHLVILSSLTT